MRKLQKKISELKKLSDRDLSTELGKTVALADARMKRTISGSGFKESKGGLIQGQNFGKSGNQAFVENLTNSQFEELQKFFETAPTLSHTFSVTNPNTGEKSEFTIEGLASFFG